MLTTILALAPVAIALLAYLIMQGLFLWALVRHRSRQRLPREACRRAPGVTILKPLAGADDDLDANLDSFAELDYPTYEILLGVASPSDSAFAAARRFGARHPDVRARIVVTDPDIATNPKVAQLVTLEARAAGEVLVISDSNVRVCPDYLWPLVHTLESPSVGLVTSIICGTGEETLGAALENLQLGAIVAPGVIACDVLSRRPLTVGKSMAMRKRDLAVIGGFRRLSDVLAEDHVLGRMFLEAGFELRTSLDAVENRNVKSGIARTMERHTRWAKMRRAICPLAFFFEPLLSPLAIAALMVLVSPTRASVLAALVSALVQVTGGFLALRIFRGRTLAWYYAPLEIVRTFVALACWGRAFVSRRITWRGNEFLLGRGTVISPVRNACILHKCCIPELARSPGQAKKDHAPLHHADRVHLRCAPARAKSGKVFRP